MSSIFDKAKPFAQVLEQTAERFNIPIGLLYGICKQESSFIATAIRWEPGFYHRYIKPRKDIPFEEAVGQAHSFGLMQIMGSTARWMGYKKDLTGLWQPIINLNYGCKYFAKLVKKYNGNLKDAIAAYNAGSARKTGDDGDYVNQEYVDRVVIYWNKYEEG